MAGSLGNLALVLALVAAVYGTVVSILGARTGQSHLVQSGDRAAVGVFALVTLAMGTLLYLMGQSDFNYVYVAQVTNRDLNPFYKYSALWGGMAGSLLLWTWVLTLFGCIVSVQNRDRNREMMPWVNATMLLTAAFFLAMNLFSSNAFDRLGIESIAGDIIPWSRPDGQGLNPLLQHPAMVIHPPVLYTGYVGFIVPFAFAMAALITRQLGDGWIKITRRWTIVAWFFLGIGVLLGGKWAYVELGWGGYWAWDPVENASLMPWLTGTAFLHSVILQERKGMLKVWNVILIVLTFMLCIFGTFLTRSGIVSSVHAFAQSDIGYYFIAYIAIVLVFCTWLIISRLPYLKTEHRLDSMISRESGFLFNNLLFLGMCFAVWWGTMFPTISEAIRGVRITVGPPFFNTVNIPILLGLLFLTGVGPLLAYRKNRMDSLRRNFTLPLAGGGALVLFLIFRMGITDVYPLISFGLCVFVTLTILMEFHRGASARSKNTGEHYALAVVNLTRRNKRRYGGYVVHFAIVLMFVGVTGSAFTEENYQYMKPGDRMTIGRYELVCRELNRGDTPNYTWFNAVLDVYSDGRLVTQLLPEKRMYTIQEQPTTEVRIHSTLREDLYVVINSIEEDGSAHIQVWVNPLVFWLWAGGITMFLGTIVIMLPDTRWSRFDRPRRRASETREATADVS